MLAALAAGAALLVAGCGGGGTPHGTALVGMKVVKSGKEVLALVPVRIDGHGPFLFALDTGASVSMVDSQVAHELGTPKVGPKEKIAGVAAVTKANLVRVAHWSVGGVRLPATTVVEANLPFGNANGGVQGLLGSDMLSRFDVVTINYANGTLRLHRRVVAAHG